MNHKNYFCFYLFYKNNKFFSIGIISVFCNIFLDVMFAWQQLQFEVFSLKIKHTISFFWVTIKQKKVSFSIISKWIFCFSVSFDHWTFVKSYYENFKLFKFSIAVKNNFVCFNIYFNKGLEIFSQYCSKLQKR